MRRHLKNILLLCAKELYSVLRDPVLLLLIGWAFTLGVFTPGKGAGDASLQNARIAIVDEDHSPLSLRIASAFYAPYFLPPRMIGFSDISRMLDSGAATFVVVIPSRFERDLTAGRPQNLQLLVDATRMKQAGIGAGYIRTILDGQVMEFLHKTRQGSPSPVNLVVRAKFNPNLIPSGFQGVVALINNITILTVILTGAAVIRERENGTIEHVLAMPVTSLEIMSGKILANVLVMLVVVWASLFFIVNRLLGLAIAGSVPLLMTAVIVYLFSAGSIGIFLATLTRSMPQMGLLVILVVPQINQLSGNNTPLESQPAALQAIMQLSPATHFVRVAHAIIFRGATLSDVWIHLVAAAGIGLIIFLLALRRFRHSMAAARG